MCTINDTHVTTHIIMAVRLSIIKPTSNFKPATSIHVNNVPLKVLPAITSDNVHALAIADANTQAIVIQCAKPRVTNRQPLAANCVPNSPASTLPNSGAKQAIK